MPTVWDFKTPARIRTPLDENPFSIFSRMTIRQGVALLQHVDSSWEEFDSIPQIFDGPAEFLMGGDNFGVSQLQGSNLEAPSAHGFVGALRIYRGGHCYIIDSDLRDELLAATTTQEPSGYAAYITNQRTQAVFNECPGDEIIRSGKHSFLSQSLVDCKTPNGLLTSGYGHGAYGHGPYGHGHS